MIYAKPVPYSGASQSGNFYILWYGSPPMIDATDSNGNTTSIIDPSFTAYNVTDVSHLTIVSGVIQQI